jgi:tetratricopeptide (TPR) repeat protein
VLLQIRHGALLFELGRRDEAMRQTVEAHGLAVREGLTPLRLAASSHIARMDVALGRHAAAISRWNDLCAAYLALGEVRLAAHNTAHLSFAHLDQGHLDHAEGCLREAWDLAHTHGDGQTVALLHHARGCLAALRDEWDGSIDHQLRAVSGYADMQMTDRTLVPRCWAAVAAQRLGDEAKAQRLIQAARDVHRAASPIPARAVMAMAGRVVADEHAAMPGDARWYTPCRLAAKAWGLAPLDPQPS